MGRTIVLDRGFREALYGRAGLGHAIRQALRNQRAQTCLGHRVRFRTASANVAVLRTASCDKASQVHRHADTTREAGDDAGKCYRECNALVRAEVVH